MEIVVHINRDVSIDHYSTATKFDIFVRERRIVSSAMFPTDKKDAVSHPPREAIPFVTDQNCDDMSAVYTSG